MDRKAFLAKIQPWIDSHAEEMIEEVQRFCCIRSVSRTDLVEENAPFGHECADMLDFATGRAEHYGFKTEIHAYQASKRGGYLYCEMKENGRIAISGKAALVAVSEIMAEL